MAQRKPAKGALGGTRKPVVTGALVQPGSNTDTQPALRIRDEKTEVQGRMLAATLCSQAVLALHVLCARRQSQPQSSAGIQSRWQPTRPGHSRGPSRRGRSSAAACTHTAGRVKG